MTSQDDSLENVMLNYWVNFASTGNPNGTGLVNWPQYTSCLTDCYLQIQPTPNGTQCGLRTAQSDLWDEIVGFKGCTNPTGINDAEKKENSFLIYPNPTSGIVTVKSSVDNEKFNVNIYDFTGKEILSENNVNQLNLSDFSNGIYLMRISQDEQSVETKIMIVH
jgi:hypothetical protein